MQELLRDSIWTFIGTVVAIAAILISIVLYIYQRQRKRLFVETIARIPLLSSHMQGIVGLQLTFKGKPVTDATILLVQVSNFGNTPILASDYETPLSLEFAKDVEVLAADVISSQPKGIPLSISTSGYCAILSPHLLNPTDIVTCRILLKNSDGKYVATCRVTGVKSIEKPANSALFMSATTLTSFFIVVGSYMLSPEPKSNGIFDIRQDELPYFVVSLIGIAIMLFGMLYDLRAQLRKIRARPRRGNIEV
jgi:hypothetical protein